MEVKEVKVPALPPEASAEEVNSPKHKRNE